MARASHQYAIIWYVSECSVVGALEQKVLARRDETSPFPLAFPSNLSHATMRTSQPFEEERTFSPGVIGHIKYGHSTVITMIRSNTAMTA